MKRRESTVRPEADPPVLQGTGTLWSLFQPDLVAFAAGRLMLARISELAAAGKSFALETTLSTRTYLRHIPQWQQAGYLVKLSFLKLPDTEFAIRRVAQRVALGGHAIPEPVIRRRFTRGWQSLRRDYLEAERFA